MKKFFEEFRKFIMRGNIVDMSVGVIVGGAFTSIVNGLTNNILKPIINWFLAMILGTDSLSEVFTYLKRVEVPELDANGVATGKMIVDLNQSIYIDWGSFINAIINFLIIAFVLFVIVKAINSINDSHKKLQDLQLRINWKNENGIKLNKKEKAFLAKKAKLEKEEEAKRLAEEEALKNQPKPVTTEDLLVEIRDLLKNK
jgi:large conductance mechanosensitive channel